MMKTTSFERVRAHMRTICLALPDTEETLTWGKPHFRVAGKIFAGCGEEGGVLTIGFKLDAAHAKAIVKDPRFRPAPYVGHKGWVSMDATGVKDWKEVQALVLESYRLIAPKRTLAKLASGEDAARAKPERARKPAPSASGRAARSTAGRAASAKPGGRGTRARAASGTTKRKTRKRSS
jgi:predicted DNA-binding protein (MmcQ/YjbR family)